MYFKKLLQKNFITYFFYKKLKIFKNSSKSEHLGEFGEDIFIRRFFKNEKKGFYVDIGCYHPIKGSLTYYLFKEGWLGLNVDISKTSIDLFKMSRPKDYNVNAAITDFDGETFYYENGLINQQNSLIGNKDNKKVKVESYRLETILNNFSIPNIDYLNIDVEGNDYKVISSLDFSKYRPKLISIEQNVYNSEKIIISETHKLLTKKNYFLASKIGVTCIYIDNKYEDKIEKIMSI
tara:strand:- start:186 stop:890 length:705 start_codon:yes stop_codon:yes gene_type:complete